MATFHPSSFAAATPSSEQKVWRALESLPAHWHVFHSVTWQAPRAGRQGDGEADFILLSPRAGLLVLEVKGGRIEVIDGQWFSIDRYGVRHAIKDPFRQATDSKHALLRYLRDVPSINPVPPVHHAVVFPDVSITDMIGMNPREIIVDAGDLTEAERSIDSVFRHWGPSPASPISSGSVRSVVELLAPTIRVSGLLRAGIAQAERQLVTLTERQSEVLSMLRTVRRCVVRGGAGTGKTLLAAAKARRLSAEGARTLLVCFNAPVVTHLANSLKDLPGVTVTTFHSLCLRLGRATNVPVPSSPDDSWFDRESANVLAEAASTMTDDEKLDALLVDEAQDLSDDWLMGLLLLLRKPDEGPVFLFLDNHQQIYRAMLSLPPTWPVVELDRNCRNTLPIARTVAGCFRDPPPTEGAEGPDISFVEADDGLLIDVVHDVVRRLLVEESLAPDQAVVLANTRNTVNRLRTMLVGPAAFVAPGRVGVVAETIHRFKGLEGEAVVLVLSGAPDQKQATVDRTLAYVGLSRARSALFIIGTRKWIQWCKALTAS